MADVADIVIVLASATGVNLLLVTMLSNAAVRWPGWPVPGGVHAVRRGVLKSATRGPEAGQSVFALAGT